MALNTETLRSRLRIAFGSDPQDMVAKKLNMTQGTISKILSGNQQPTLETIYHIAEAYNVSVDWLLGLSEKRQVTKYNGETTYAIATETIGDLVKKGAKIDNEKKSPEAVIHIEDPLLRMLLRKSITLAETDRDMYENWAKEKLSLFADSNKLLAASVKSASPTSTPFASPYFLCTESLPRLKSSSSMQGRSSCTSE